MTCYAVIDTNVLVSSLLSKKDDSATVQVLGKVIIGEVIPVYSNVITKEYRKVLSRKKFDFSGDTIEYLLSAVEKYGILIDNSPRYEGSPFLRGSSRKTGCQRISCHRKYQEKYHSGCTSSPPNKMRLPRKLVRLKGLAFQQKISKGHLAMQSQI